MRNAGKVVSKTMILSHVWDYNFDPQTNIVDVLVSRLRDKIDRPFETKLLHTVRGVGYVLRSERERGVRSSFGLRLGVWYATLFVAGSMVIVSAHLLADRRRRWRSAISRSSQQARRYAAGLRRGGLARSPRRCRPSSRPRPSGCSCASSIAAPKRSSSASREGWDRRDARNRVAPARATARSSRSGRAPRRGDDLLARFRAALGLVDAVDRGHRADRRLAGHAVGAPADPAAHGGRAAHHRDRADRRARAGRPSTTTRSTS